MNVADFYQKVTHEEIKEEELKQKLKTTIKSFFPSYKANSVSIPGTLLDQQLMKLDKLDSVLIKTNEQQELIKSWIGYPSSLKLIYRGTRNGFKGQKFHFLCDNKGPSLTVYKS